MIPPRWLTAMLLAVVLSVPLNSQARVFVLPGVYYNQDLGWAFTVNGIVEDPQNDRFRANLDVYQSAIGQVKFSCFLPRATREWNFLFNYQFQNYPRFSQTNPDDPSALVSQDRRMVELSASCDFRKPEGYFYGFQAAFRYFNYSLGTVNISDELSPGEIPGLLHDDGEEIFGSLRVGLETRDNRYYTRSGTYLLWQLDLGQSRSDSLNTMLVRWNAEVRRYIPLGWDRTILALNLRGGNIHTNVPYFSQFTLGGQSSLRGFPNDRYSGDAYYLTRAEVRQTVVDSLTISMEMARTLIHNLPDFTISAGLVLFTEGGDLWREDHSWWGFRQTAGMGLRFILPPSVVACLDFARPVAGEDWSFYLSLDQSF
jgi:outer membrane translocation and assembly module TamA